MSNAIGAPPLSISIDGREFQTLNDSAGNPEQGGYDSEFNSNGNPATGRIILTPVGWSLPDQGIVIDSTAGDWEYLNEKKNNATECDIVITYHDSIYGASGYIVGKLAWTPMAASASISLMGSGKLEQQ